MDELFFFFFFLFFPFFYWTGTAGVQLLFSAESQIEILVKPRPCRSHLKGVDMMAVIFICDLLPCPHVSGEWTTQLYVCAVAQFCQAKNFKQRLITNRCANPTQQNHLHQPSLMNERILLQMGNEEKKRWKPNIWNEWTALPWQFWSCDLSLLGACYWFGIMTFK